MQQIIDNALAKLDHSKFVPFCSRFCYRNSPENISFQNRLRTILRERDGMWNQTVQHKRFNNAKAVCPKEIAGKNVGGITVAQGMPSCKFVPFSNRNTNKKHYKQSAKPSCKVDLPVDLNGEEYMQSKLNKKQEENWNKQSKSVEMQDEKSKTVLDMTTVLKAYPGEKVAYDHEWLNYLHHMGAKRISPSFLEILAGQNSAAFKMPVKVAHPGLGWLNYLSNQKDAALTPEFFQIMRDNDLFKINEPAQVYKSVDDFMENTHIDKLKPDWANYFRTVMGNYVNRSVFGIDFINNINYQAELGNGMEFLDFISTPQLEYILRIMAEDPSKLTKEQLEYLSNFLASLANLTLDELEKYIQLNPHLFSPKIVHMIKQLLYAYLNGANLARQSALFNLIKKLADIETHLGYKPHGELQMFAIRSHDRYEDFRNVVNRKPYVAKSRTHKSTIGNTRIAKRITKVSEPDADDIFYVVKPWQQQEVTWAHM